MLWRSDRTGAVRFLVTDRRDGRSDPPYDELNLGTHVGDDPARVRANRERAAAHAGVPPDRLVFLHQTHGTTVAVLDAAPPPGETPRADAAVTARPGLALAVLVADCAPVLLASPSAGVLGVAHAGRRGMAGGVVAATLAAMAELGAAPATVSALVGPAICGRCYGVPRDLQDDVAAVVPAARATTAAGEPALDVRAGIRAQLEAAGVRAVEVDGGCTAEADRLYSYRRDGVTGRFAGIAVLEGDVPR